MTATSSPSSASAHDGTAVDGTAVDGAAPVGAALAAVGLRAGYHAGRRPVPIVGPADLSVHRGRFVAVLGPNGAGKTTLLRTLGGVIPPLDGRVTATTASGTRELTKMKRADRATHIAVVLTDHPDVGLLRARDIVAIGRHPHTGWSGRMTARDHQMVDDALEAVGATHLADRELARLSDGQRQRVWIARALAQEPAVLLLDEPTAFLDLPGRVEAIGLLRRLAATRDLAVVASIHDLDLALRVADTAWLLDGSGTVEVGAPEDLALDGAIDRAFGRDDIRFDLATASFQLPVDCCAEVSVTGADGRDPDPTRALWTGRALARAGAVVVDRSAWLTVEVLPDRWRLHGPETVECTTLQQLAEAVRAAGLVVPTGDRQ